MIMTMMNYNVCVFSAGPSVLEIINSLLTNLRASVTRDPDVRTHRPATRRTTSYGITRNLIQNGTSRRRDE